MSDNLTITLEGAVAALRAREADLNEEYEIASNRCRALSARLDELRQTIERLTNVRPKQGRPRGSTNKAKIPPARHLLDDYDDSVSIGEVRGILSPTTIPTDGEQP